jgi:predicted acyltransferase
MSSQAIEPPQTLTSARLVSLDVLRGITIAFMILVNNSGEHAYWPFHHAQWNGWTPTDLVFPTFLFLVGVSIVFSTESRLRRGATKASLLAHTVRRFIILFLLGLVVNGFPFFHLGTLRIYGVLQRIAICFLLGSLLYLWDRGRVSSKVVLLIAALAGYWALMRWVPVPGHGVPGRDIPLLDKDANLVAWLDRHIFPGRLYEKTRDPEGLLSDLPAMGTMLIGMLTGIWLRTQRSLEQKCMGLLGAGVMGIVLGEVWNLWFPINKKLWTSSYVLFAAGCALLGLGLCFWVIEIKGWKKGWTWFWLVFGTNAIAAYVFSELLAAALYSIRVSLPGVPGSRTTLSHALSLRLFDPIHPAGVGSLLYSICFVLVCWLPVLVLYRKKIFIKI